MPAPALKRDAGRIGLLFASLGGMIGSGWLFGAMNAAKLAGPASLLAWVIGGVAVLLLAFVFAELSTMFPQPGAVIVFPYLCFGRLAAQVMSWVNFLAYISVPPVEAVSVINYSNNFIPGLVNPASGMLTMTGVAAAVALMALFLGLNMLAIRLVLKINNAITWWKLLVPAGTVAALLLVHMRARNFTQFGFAPTGMNGVLAAVSESGVVFAYLGFRQAIELAGETSNPGRSLPFAIVGSVLLCILLYCGLEAAFIGALTPADLAGGWAKLNFAGISGPFAGLASGLGLTWLAITLYADAAISPGGTGIIYNTTAARVIYATAEAGFMPRLFTQVSGNGVPVTSLLLNFCAGLLFLLPLPSWRLLASYISSIGVIAYGIGPLVLLSFRQTLPEGQYRRPFRLGMARIFAPMAFIVANLVVFWAGANVTNHLLGGLLLIFLVYCGQQLATRGTLRHLEWRGAWWMGPYFGGLWLITFLGPAQGTGTLSNLGGTAVISVFSLGIIQLAARCAQSDPQMAKANYMRTDGLRIPADAHMPMARR